MNIFRLYSKNVVAAKTDDTSDAPAHLSLIRHAGMVVGLCAIVFGMMVLGGNPTPFAKLHLGEVSPTDIFAPISFQYPDTAQMDDRMARKLREIAPIYFVDKALTEKSMGRLAGFAAFLVQIRKQSDTPKDIQKDLLSRFGVKSTPEDVQKLLSLPEFQEPQLARLNARIKALLDAGMASAAFVAQIPYTPSGLITLRAPHSGADRDVLPKNLPQIEKISREDLFPPTLSLAERGGFAPEAERLLAALMPQLLEPNLVYSQALTDEAKEQAVSKLPVIYKFVKKGEIIVRRGDGITKEHIEKLQGLGEALSTRTSLRDRWRYPAGVTLMLLLFGGVFVIYVTRYRKTAALGDHNLMLIYGLLSVTLVGSYLLFTNFASTDFYWIGYLPLAPITSIIAGALCGPHVAMLLTFLLSWALAIICGMDASIGLVNMVSGLIAICSLKGVGRRSALLWVGLNTGVAAALAQAGLWLIETTDLKHLLILSVADLFSGVACAALVLLVLPAIENLFKITTDFSLLELSDLNHPLLKELMLRAPGTYHHSMMVANLAEAAAEQVGANPLVCRVGAYFHDIGKLDKPEYFSENESAFEKSIHDDLSPSMSSLIIISHVKNGLEKARAAGLPKPVTDAIAQHHGTSVVYCFFKKAEKANAEEGLEVKEEQFRYPGPKPQTREAGILMLADIVEAASRSLTKHSPGRIEGLVKDLINNKFIEAQLDECPLTLKDLHLITERFIRMLTAVFHTRREYPRNPRTVPQETHAEN